MAGIGRIATSGMNAAMADMQEISNNIANVNTIGFKQAMVNFADVSSKGSMASGLGVKVSSIMQDFSPGQMEITNQALDVSVNKDGFFVQKDPTSGEIRYTRAGRFNLTQDGYIMGLSGRVQGFPALNGQIMASAPLADLQIPQTPASPVASKQAKQLLNLDSTSVAPTVPFSTNDPVSYNYRVESTLYDSLGNPNVLSVFYVKTADNAWNANVTVNGTAVSNFPTGTVGFNTDGTLSAATGLDALAWTPPNGAATPQALAIQLDGTTQFASSNQVTKNQSDGSPAGVPVGFAIDKDGNLNVNYSNGRTITQGQIALAQFDSPQNLTRSDDMSWMASSLSGEANVNQTDSKNAFTSGAIEGSNVDLSNELVLLLNSQHNFQANAQVEQTYNQILQTVEKL
jgi:flagellar hook protein FlgE